LKVAFGLLCKGKRTESFRRFSESPKEVEQRLKAFDMEADKMAPEKRIGAAQFDWFL